MTRPSAPEAVGGAMSDMGMMNTEQMFRMMEACIEMMELMTAIPTQPPPQLDAHRYGSSQMQGS